MSGNEPELEFECYTLEDQYRMVKEAGKTRIPPGRFEITLRTVGGMNARYLDRFGWHKGMLWLRAVPGFKWIYIHPGNRHEHTEGCILTGDGTSQNVTDDGMVTSSTAAYERLAKRIYSKLEKDWRVFITITDVA